MLKNVFLLLSKSIFVFIGIEQMALLAKSTSHSFDNALALAQASGLAYADAEGPIREGLALAVGSPPLSFRSFDIPAHETNAYVAEFQDAILIAFRGTTTPANWLTDWQIPLVPFQSTGLVHEGFQDALGDAFSQILETLDDLSGQGRTLWITGHSLGGALALLCAARLRFPAEAAGRLPKPIAGIYTFGQPRVGDQAFCTACDADFGRFYFRYINLQDIVTRVPPRELGYRHIDHIQYITGDGTIESDPAWWHVFLDRVQAGVAAVERLRLTRPLTGLIADHSIRDYIAKINAYTKLPTTQNIPPTA